MNDIREGLGPISARADQKATIFRSKVVIIIWTVLILNAINRLINTSVTLWTTCLAVSCKVYIYVLTQRTNILPAYCLVDKLVIIHKSIVWFLACVTLVQVSTKACQTSFMAILTLSWILIRKFTILAFLDADVRLQKDFQSRCCQVTWCAVCRCNVACIAIVIAFTTWVD